MLDFRNRIKVVPIYKRTTSIIGIVTQELVCVLTSPREAEEIVSYLNRNLPGMYFSDAPVSVDPSFEKLYRIVILNDDIKTFRWRVVTRFRPPVIRRRYVAIYIRAKSAIEASVQAFEVLNHLPART